MDWKAQLTLVWQVQILDRRIDALRMQRQALLTDSEGESRERAMHADQERLRALTTEIDDLQRRQRLAEIEHKGQVAEREKLQRRLYGGEVRNARDLAGLEKNMEGVEQHVSRLETDILQAMESLEIATNKRTMLERRVAAHRQQLEQHRQQVRIHLGELDRELPGLLVAREEAARPVDAAVLREYERLRGKPGGIAVARAENGVCGGCGVELSTLVRARLRHPEERVSCEYCGRLLFED